MAAVLGTSRVEQPQLQDARRVEAVDPQHRSSRFRRRARGHQAHQLGPCHLHSADLRLDYTRQSLTATNDEFLMTTKWSLRAGGQVVMSEPRHVVLRDTINHLAHHRGQLTVYLRLLGAPVPAVYGPSADDAQFL